MGLLTSRPSPEQVLAIRPSPELQARVSELLDRGKRGELVRQEEAELERYLMLLRIEKWTQTLALGTLEKKSNSSPN